jgi:hypothetical protein
MIKQFIAAFVLTVLIAGLALAQAPTKLTGTVSAVSTDVVTIKDKDGKPTMVMLDKSTKYVKDKKAVTAADVKVGATITIEAKMDTAMNMYTAQQVDVTAATVAVPAGK